MTMVMRMCTHVDRCADECCDTDRCNADILRDASESDLFFPQIGEPSAAPKSYHGCTIAMFMVMSSMMARYVL